MIDAYTKICENSLNLLELVGSCFEEPEKTLALSVKILKQTEDILSNSKRLEGMIGTEATVLEKKVKQFLEHPDNETRYEEIKEIGKRIYNEASSY